MSVVLGSTTIDARSFGALGDGTTDDTDAINAALASPGVQRVVLGGTGRTYLGEGILIPSNVTLDLGGNTLRAVDCTSYPAGSVRPAIYAALGNVTSAGVITGATPPEGSFVSVYHGSKSKTQADVATATGTSSSTTLTIQADPEGDDYWYPFSGGHLWVNNELVSYTSYTAATGVFAGLSRGLFGTTAASWSIGAAVAAAENAVGYYEGGTLRPIPAHPARSNAEALPPVNLTSVPVYWGTINSGLENGIVDGYARVADTWWLGLNAMHSRGFRCQGVTFKDCRHGGVYVSNSADFIVDDCNFDDIGLPAGAMGAAIWFFGHVYFSKITRNRIYGETTNGIYLDNRTQPSNPNIDGPLAFCEISGNDVNLEELKGIGDGYANMGILLASEIYFTNVISNRVNDAYDAIYIFPPDQGVGDHPMPPMHNSIVGNVIVRATHAGIYKEFAPDNLFDSNVFVDCEDDIL